MDSGNSGSLQSSSGGDDEYDSRTESISSFLNSSAFNQPLTAAAPPPQQQQNQNQNHQHQLLSHHHHQQSAGLFDPFQQSLQNPYAHHQNQNMNQSQQQQNHDLLWSRGLRSDSGNHFGGITPQSVLNNQLTQQQQPPLPPPSSHLPTDVNAAAKGGGGGGDNNINNHQPTAVKNPKKRTRASRRAPTTVLTTDTTNFRQMVQEFTGIPTAPFSAGGGATSYPRRLDLFSTGGGTSNLGLYPLRPAAQKPHHQNTFMDSANSQNLLNMQNQMLSFQPNNPNPNNNSNNIPSFLLAGKSPGMLNNAINSNNSNSNSASLPSYDELGLGHNAASLGGNLWRDGGTGAAAAVAHVSNYSAAAPDFLHHHEKDVSSGGGEGTVGSWNICPSD